MVVRRVHKNKHRMYSEFMVNMEIPEFVIQTVINESTKN